MAKHLVIVESPTKAKTIGRFLPESYVVESSIGHVRDLPSSAGEVPAEVKKKPWGRLGVDIEGGFLPVYVIPEGKKKQIAKLKSLMKDAHSIYLATDEDREGESISWHLLEVLKPKVKIERLVFHEITKEAIAKSLTNTRSVDLNLVKAQETRRVLDRLYGYEISPLLWRKIAPSLSAGRVQSVALRWIVEREYQRRRFVSARYWGLIARLAAQKQAFEATLLEINKKRIAVSKDFDENRGALKPSLSQRVSVLNQAEAHALSTRLPSQIWKVLEVQKKSYSSSPAAPFITSTLQQEASRKLYTSAREVMRTAQSLYEKGHITYMRTDSIALSSQAIKAARKEIETRYGKAWVNKTPRQHRSSARNAQEAHEAIRPAGETFAPPESLNHLNPAERRLYELIWKRTLASQMSNAQGQRTQVRLQAGEAVFQTSGKTIDFAGFLRVYVEGSDDPESDLGDQERILPEMQVGDILDCKAVVPQQHTTKPPARYTEASLIKTLESRGVGRPSTFASIIDTILRRDYVHKKNNALVPTFVALAVVRLLEEHFTTLVDSDFTAQMEEALDAIARGERKSLPYLHAFYFGEQTPNGPDAALEKSSPGRGGVGLKTMLEVEIDARKASTLSLDDNKQPGDKDMVVRIGRYGPYLEQDGKRATLPLDLNPDELTLTRAQELLTASNNNAPLGLEPKSGLPIYMKRGRYGPYVQLGESDQEPTLKSLPPNATEETFDLPSAILLLSLPREIGLHPESKTPIVADLGRYGPYLRMDKESRTLKQYEQLFHCTLEEALVLFAQPKAKRWGATVLRTIGAHPSSGKDVNLCNGRYGHYVTDGETNASLRQQNPDTINLEEALELLAQRASVVASKGGIKKKRNASNKKAGITKSTSKKVRTTKVKVAASKKTAATKQS